MTRREQSGSPPPGEWRLISETPGLGPAGRLPLIARRYRTPGGDELEWDVIDARPSVAVLALTPDDQVVLARQFRTGPAAILDEMPGGGIEPGEQAIDAAARELREETGYAGELEMVGSIWWTAGATTRRHVAVARAATRVAEPDPESYVRRDAAGERRRLPRPVADRGAHQRRLGYLALDHLGRL